MCFHWEWQGIYCSIDWNQDFGMTQTLNMVAAAHMPVSNQIKRVKRKCQSNINRKKKEDLRYLLCNLKLMLKKVPYLSGIQSLIIQVMNKFFRGQAFCSKSFNTRTNAISLACSDSNFWMFSNHGLKCGTQRKQLSETEAWRQSRCLYNNGG